MKRRLLSFLTIIFFIIPGKAYAQSETIGAHGLAPAAAISLGIAAVCVLLALLLLWRQQKAHTGAKHVQSALRGMNKAQPLDGESTRVFLRESNVSTYTADSPPIPRSRQALLQYSILGVTLLLVAGMVLPVALYTRALRLMEQSEFIEAQRVMQSLGFVADWFPEDQSYIDAGASLANGAYDQAIDAFNELGMYRNAALLLLESKYQKARMLLSLGDTAGARPLLQEMKGYKDTDALLQAIVE